MTSHAISCALTFFDKKVRIVMTDLDTAVVAFDRMSKNTQIKTNNSITCLFVSVGYMEPLATINP